MKRSAEAGFGIVETLMSMLLVGVILGIVARGYQAMNRLNLATYQMSQRMELSAFLQRLSYETSSALSIAVLTDGFTFERIDPTFNLQFEDSSIRLPWPIPPTVVTADPMSAAYRVETEYRFNSAENRIERTAFSETTVEAVSVGAFDVSLEPGGRTILVSMKPKEMTAAVAARILLPVVQP